MDLMSVINIDVASCHKMSSSPCLSKYFNYFNVWMNVGLLWCNAFHQYHDTVIVTQVSSFCFHWKHLLSSPLQILSHGSQQKMIKTVPDYSYFHNKSNWCWNLVTCDIRLLWICSQCHQADGDLESSHVCWYSWLVTREWDAGCQTIHSASPIITSNIVNMQKYGQTRQMEYELVFSTGNFLLELK